MDAATVSRDAAPRPVAEAEQLLTRAQNLAAAVLGQQIIDLHRRCARAQRGAAGGNQDAVGGTGERGDFVRRYRRLTMDYTDLLADIVAADRADRPDVDRLTERLEQLIGRGRELADSLAVPGN
ncbi:MULTISPECIES: DUF6403 family protein [unclassified Solwaraspora]|uniref:DUF6403 family protein n=1 Tax=unclassified Solwaraspora TaxID=2627926 RepID=UPI00248CC4C6|nr:MULTISPECIES: DUF6403 family protein [unclassified Solwaraspora]WBC00356.1 DUF6403 family protein [Solwaraspora sp. WMMA2059]WBC24034.1 DUF6403 family protein [Solwaraspora sp. WMMA2080]WJK37739.1 DUF6403 family protein [Solwaraspora sp. WMMA2065]